MATDQLILLRTLSAHHAIFVSSEQQFEFWRRFFFVCVCRIVPKISDRLLNNEHLSNSIKYFPRGRGHIFKLGSMVWFCPE